MSRGPWAAPWRGPASCSYSQVVRTALHIDFESQDDPGNAVNEPGIQSTAPVTPSAVPLRL
eukprot:856850-Alexandrium_andersonii.AAC.1